MAKATALSLYPIKAEYSSNNLYSSIIVIGIIKGKVADLIVNLKRVKDSENL